MATPARSASAAVVSGSPASTSWRAAATIAATLAALRCCCGAARVMRPPARPFRVREHAAQVGTRTRNGGVGRSRGCEGGHGLVELGQAIAEDAVGGGHAARRHLVGASEGGAERL